LIADRDSEGLVSFESSAKCFGRSEDCQKQRPKYRAINGYGNNLKHPFWGAANTPFERFGPKTYDDGVNLIRKSVTGEDLPNPRKLVQEVLMKAQKYPRVKTDPNELTNFFVLTITHDMAFQVPHEAFDNCKDIRCCGKGNKKALSKELQSSACLPIAIADNDSFYKDFGVKCLNLVRSEIASSPDTLQYGEVLNKVTAFLDLSIVYGSSEVEAKKLRRSKGGKLNMGAKNLIPTDLSGKYTSISNRLISVPQSAIWPAIFSRNHNNICDGLIAVNPNWNDEKLYQEARRINIAVFQNLIFGGTVIEQVFKKKVNESYSESFNPSTYLEFTTAAYRFLHYYLNPNMKLVTIDSIVTEIPVSDTFGRIDVLEDRFDDVLRGSLSQKLNYGPHSEEVSNKFAKNEKGVGLDIFSFDIQRGLFCIDLIFYIFSNEF
jgi:peroxidase